MTSSRSLCQRLSAIGLRQELARALTDQVVSWVRSSGPEWTVEHLKDIKAYHLARYARVEWKPSHWHARRRDGSLKGPFGELRGDSFKQVARTLQACQSYSLFVSKEVTPKQAHKFLSSVKSNHPDLPSRASVLNDMRKHVLRQMEGGPRGTRTVSAPQLFTTHSWTPERRAPLKERTVSEDTVESWLPDNLASMTVRSLVENYKSLSAPAGFYQYMRQVQVDPQNSQVGAIAFIQEPGFKLRAVANPSRVVQSMLSALQKDVFTLLRGNPRDCTHDQMKGVEQVRQWLKEGKKVYSFDLSDATNNFPLSYQLSVLSEIYDLTSKPTYEAICLFAEASRSPWRMPGGEQITFSRGQPLGLGPSFAVFALSHHHVLSNLREKFGGDYVMLGDDIAIIGDDLAAGYRSRMTTDLLVPISESKSLVSDRVGEFAGKVISQEGIITLGKFRQVSDRSFLEVMRLHGPQAIGLLRPRQRRVVKALAEVPEFLGGLGWNSKGKPLEARIQKALELGLWGRERPVEVPYRDLTAAHIAILNRVAYGAGIEWNQFHSPPDRPTRTVLSNVDTTAGVREGFGPHEHLSGKYHVGRLDTDPRGATALQVLERKLQLTSFIKEIKDSATGPDALKGLSDRRRGEGR